MEIINNEKVNMLWVIMIMAKHEILIQLLIIYLLDGMIHHIWNQLRSSGNHTKDNLDS